MPIPEEVKTLTDARIRGIDAEKINRQSAITGLNIKIDEYQAIVDDFTEQRDAILAEITDLDTVKGKLATWRLEVP